LQGMKIFVLITLFCLLFSETIFAQEVTSPDNEADSISSSVQQPKMAKKPVKSLIRSWVLEKQNSTVKSVLVDTATLNFHNYTPIFQKSITNTYLGYLGAPYISNNFFDRINYSDYYFLTSMQAYRRTQREITYYNTTTPFSWLKYEQGDNEQMFTAFFTQNIDSSTNFGFRYNVLKNNGQYNYQEANHNNLNLFISRNSKRYNGYASFISASDKVVENGGIIDSFINLSRKPYDLLVNINESLGPTIKTMSFFTSHEYLLGGIPSLFKKDLPTDTVFVPRFSVQYSLEMNDYKRGFYETSAKSVFFDTSYFYNSAKHTDTSSFRRFTQIFQIKALENQNRKFTFGKRIFLENEIVRATHPIPFGERKFNYSNLFLGGEISNSTSNFLQWNALARFAVLGRNFGDAIVKGVIDKPIALFQDTVMISLEGWYQDISPDIFQEHWNDNHYKWENNFKKQHEVVFKATLYWDKINLNASANYAMMSNFLYNGRNTLPSQFSGEFSVFSLLLNKEFNLGPFGWNNKVVFQKVSNDTVLHLPSLNYYTSIYFKGVLFKVLKYQLGAEMYYHSKFYADKYEPSTSRFYVQDDILTGGYPQLNAFINAKLKRTSAFAQLMHFNSSFSNGKFFSSPFYPINQMAFRFGFLWSFYD
jgi:hypothetical protein